MADAAGTAGAVNAWPHLPLNRAYLCSDPACECVSDDAVRCPSCGSAYGQLSLRAVLNRTGAEAAWPGINVGGKPSGRDNRD